MATKPTPDPVIQYVHLISSLLPLEETMVVRATATLKYLSENPWKLAKLGLSVNELLHLLDSAKDFVEKTQEIRSKITELHSSLFSNPRSE